MKLKLKTAPPEEVHYGGRHARYQPPGLNSRNGSARRRKTQQEIDRDIEAFEKEDRRAIYLDVCRFEVVTPGTNGAEGEPYLSSVQRGAFDRWLSEHDPGDLTFSIDHEPAPARWTGVHVSLSRNRLWGRAVVDEGFEDLVDLAQQVAGCSFAGDVIRSTERGSRDGLPVFNIHEINLRDAGLATTSPADPECRVRSAGNAAAMRARHLQFVERGLLAQPGGEAFAWRPRFAS